MVPGKRRGKGARRTEMIRARCPQGSRRTIEQREPSIVTFDGMEADAAVDSQSYIAQRRSIRRISQDDDQN